MIQRKVQYTFKIHDIQLKRKLQLQKMYVHNMKIYIY